MSFKAKVSIDANGVKEERSVLFILNLLVGKTHNKIDMGTTQSNIDGYIELLDSTNRINGKITVQVKTVNKRDEGYNRYPCPASLFAYAEKTTDNVFLLAVDHSYNKVLWKHISHKLLNENRDKENQDTITLHFESSEELRTDNVDETLKTWLKICKSYIEFLCRKDDIIAENKSLKAKLLEMPENKTTLNNEDISEIQHFFDIYNKLIDNEFKCIKMALFPNVWKRGMAIYSYTESSLEYSLFNIKYGEMLPPIMQLEPQSLINLDFKYDYASFSCAGNDIKRNSKQCALRLIKKHVDGFIKRKKIIPADETFLIEYVYDFIEANWRCLHLKKDSELDVSLLIQHFQSKYPHINNVPTRVASKGKSIYINTVYEAVKSLFKIGYTTIPNPYPRKGSYGNTGMIYDSFSSSTALEKSRIVILNTIRAYQNFIQSEFPFLTKELDAFYGGNLISVLVDYSDPGHKVIFHIYYSRSVLPSDEKIITIEDIGNSRIMQENGLTPTSNLFVKKTILFNGQEFSVFRMGGLNDMTILFDEYNCLTYFYELMKTHFDDYFKKNGL